MNIIKQMTKNWLPFLSVIAFLLCNVLLCLSYQDYISLAQRSGDEIAFLRVASEISGIYQLDVEALEHPLHKDKNNSNGSALVKLYKKPDSRFPPFLEIAPDGEISGLNLKKSGTWPLTHLGMVEMRQHNSYLRMKSSSSLDGAKIKQGSGINESETLSFFVPTADGHEREIIYRKVNPLKETRRELIEKYGYL